MVQYYYSKIFYASIYPSKYLLYFYLESRTVKDQSVPVGSNSMPWENAYTHHSSTLRLLYVSCHLNHILYTGSNRWYLYRFTFV